MKTQNPKGTIFLFLIFIVFFIGCKKEEKIEQILQMKDLKVDNRFSWNASKSFTIKFSNVPAGVIRISSEDGSLLYDKFYSSGSPDVYMRTLNLPVSVKKIMINEFLVNLTTNGVDFTFPDGGKCTEITNYSMNFDGATSWIQVPGTQNIPFGN